MEESRGKEHQGQAPGPRGSWPAHSRSLVLGIVVFGTIVGLFPPVCQDRFGTHFRGKICWKAFLRKKVSKSGHVHGHRNSPTTAPLRPTTPKPASGNERAIKKRGGGGPPPRLFASGLSLEKAWIPRPGPGGNPPRRSGPAPVQTRTTCRYGKAAPGSLQTKREGPKAFPFLPSRVMLWLPSFACRCRRYRWGWSQSPAFHRRAPSPWPPPGRT